MRLNFLNVSARLAAVALIALFAAGVAMAQDSQNSAASKTVKFDTVAKTDALYTGAMDAHDKDAAEKMVGKKGAFKGTVTKAFTPRSGGIVILNFDDDYKTAMTAVLKKSDFSKFPDVSKLVGQEIVVSGKFIDFKGSPEIELIDPKQIAIVK
jgi:hypothetical protein